VARDDFSLAVKTALKMRASLICSNPDCRKQTVAPSESEEDKFVSLGKAAHITAAAVGGPRYDANLSSTERAAISNAIYLCSGCADLVDKNCGRDFPTSTLKSWKEEHERWVSANLNKQRGGVGGEGGSGTIIGNRGTVIGGRGGSSGIAGVGGKGGGGFIQGDDGLIIGGDGGSCATSDGRGGKGARGPTERLGFSTSTWGYGRGGSSENHPEYNRRIKLLAQFRSEFQARFPSDAPYIDAGVDIVPTDWINQRLIECGESWQIELGENGYLLPAL
jgi:hypothetical protein